MAQNIVNALLIRWAGGFTIATDPSSISTYGRLEGFLSLGNVTDEATAVTLGNAVLADQSVVQLTETGVVMPTGAGDSPYQAFGVGDTITAPDLSGSGAAFRVQTIQVQEDTEGNPIYPIQVGTYQQLRDVRVQAWLQRMNAGTLAGTAQSASPAIPGTAPAVITTGITQTWHMPGTLTVAVSDDWSPPRSGTAIRLDLKLTTPGSSGTTVVFVVDSVVIGSVTIPAGASIPVAPLSLNTALVGVGTPNASVINLYVIAAGTGAAGLVMTLTIL